MPRITKPGPQAVKRPPILRAPEPEPPKVMVPRLPPGSAKLHVWDGKVWIGTLKVLDSPELVCKSKNERFNLQDLDAAYRAWLSEQDDATKARHTEHLK
jgi:hypothetical protein